MGDDGKKQVLAEQAEKAKVAKLAFKNFMIPRRVLKGHFGKIYAVAWGPDSRRLVSASQDGKLIIWNAFTTFKEAVIVLRSSWVMTCAYSPNGQMVAAGGLDNTVSVYKLGTETERKVSQEKPTAELAQHEGYLSCCRFIDNKQIVSSSGDGSCILWDLERRAPKQVFTEHKGDVMAVSTNEADPNYFVSGSTDTLAKVWDIRQSGKKSVISFAGHEADINSVQFIPDGTAFGTGSDDASCGLFDLRAAAQINKYADSKILGGMTSVAFSKTGRFLFASDDETMVHVWDTLHATRVSDLGPHELRVSCVQVSPDGQALCTASWDTTIKIWA